MIPEQLARLLGLMERAADRLQDYAAYADGSFNDPLAMDIRRELAALQGSPTGRVTKSEPQMQTFAPRTEEAKAIIAAFRAKHPEIVKAWADAQTSGSAA